MGPNVILSAGKNPSENAWTEQVGIFVPNDRLIPPMETSPATGLRDLRPNQGRHFFHDLVEGEMGGVNVSGAGRAGQR
jgi:hypothetical protein